MGYCTSNKQLFIKLFQLKYCCFSRNIKNTPTIRLDSSVHLEQDLFVETKYSELFVNQFKFKVNGFPMNRTRSVSVSVPLHKQQLSIRYFEATIIVPKTMSNFNHARPTFNFVFSILTRNYRIQIISLCLKTSFRYHGTLPPCG